MPFSFSQSPAQNTDPKCQQFTVYEILQVFRSTLITFDSVSDLSELTFILNVEIYKRFVL